MCDKKSKFNIDYIVVAVYAVTLTVLSIVFKQDFIKVLPCFVSMAVMVFQAYANKFGFLLGALNCCIYAVGYYLEGVYASMAEALILSLPMQLAAFFVWARNEGKSKNTTRNLTPKQALITAVCAAAVWVGTYFIFKALGDSSLILDNSIFVLSIVIYLYTILGFVESRLLLIVSNLISLIMWTIKTVGDIKSVTYIVLSVYNLYMSVKGFITWKKIAKIQNNISETDG